MTLQSITVSQIRLSKALVLLGDGCALLFSGAIATVGVAAARSDSVVDWLSVQDMRRYGAWLWMVLLVLFLLLTRYRHYSERKPFWSELGHIWGVLALVSVLDLSLMALTRWNASRLWWLVCWLFAWWLLPLGRWWVRSLMIRYRLWQRPTVIVGCGENAREALSALNSEPGLGFEVVCFVDPEREPADVLTVAMTVNDRVYPCGSVSQLSQWSQQPGTQFVIALDEGSNSRREDVLRLLSQCRAEDVCVIPSMRGVPLHGTDMGYFFSRELVVLKLRHNLRHWPNRGVKRVVDVLVASILLILSAIPMLCAAVWIRRDGGPALFRHQRVGRTGQSFDCLKFRTMHMDAQQQLAHILADNPDAREQWEKERKLRVDPRVTGVGHWLRRSSLDEWPQLINVIRGDMSLVGPRPVMSDELARYGHDVAYYTMVRPGMTGLWQVSGRNDLDYDVRVNLDVWYVKNWSLWYDFVILMKTFRVVWSKEGAY